VTALPVEAGPPVRFGVWLHPDAAVDRLVDAVVAAESAGFDEVWIADEGVARDPMVVLAAAAQRTSTVRLGVGITSPVLRHPGAVAATASTIAELSDGRFVLGWGVGGTESLDPFGLAYERPVALMRGALETARAVLGRRETAHYSPPPHGLPATTVPLFVGSRGERINRLASGLADGVFLSGFAASDLGPVVGWARSVRPIDVAIYQSVRFVTDTRGDPTSVGGGPGAIAEVLGGLAEAHAPASIGMALVDHSDPVEMVGWAAGVLDQLGR